MQSRLVSQQQRYHLGSDSGLTIQHNSLAHNIKLRAAMLPMFKAPENCRRASPPMISIVDDDKSVRKSTKALVRSFAQTQPNYPRGGSANPDYFYYRCFGRANSQSGTQSRGD